ncbi:F-box protein [Endozoicomonas sp. 8E]|uniref:F-box protein n=1 Tax=Endozoicomonas sp. 8E TaxID=3035692 RepID=UPI002938E594|nr:F-box protein [Endozoicomonas sp. 8E]WOG26052.1 F-box protein [Endozoicomonas sp. 8E]
MDIKTDNSGMIGSLLPSTKLTRFAREPSGFGAGRSIVAADKELKETASLLDLPEELTIKIIRLLAFRDIVRLRKVSTYFNRVIKNDHALEKAWYQRFTAQDQDQLKTILSVEDKKQLCLWLPLQPLYK